MQTADNGTQEEALAPPAERLWDGRTPHVVAADAGPACEVCGAPARVRVLEGYDGEQPIQRDYCLGCASTTREISTRNGNERRRLSGAALIALAGVTLGLLAVTGDLIGTSHAGFGHWQRWGVLLGAIAVFLGGVVRADVVMFSGLLVFICSVGADWIGGGVPGFGWKQEFALVLAGVCLLAAGLLRLRQSLIARRHRFVSAEG